MQSAYASLRLSRNTLHGAIACHRSSQFIIYRMMEKRVSKVNRCPCQSLPGRFAEANNKNEAHHHFPSCSRAGLQTTTSTIAPVVCGSCVYRAIQGARTRREEALQEHMIARKECEDDLKRLHEDHGRHPKRMLGWERERQELSDRLESLRRTSSQLAMQVAQATLRNQERRELYVQTNPINSVSEPMDHLHRLNAAVKDGAMASAVNSAKFQVKMLRFQWAIQAFETHRLDVGDGQESASSTDKNDSNNDTNTRRRGRGIGKIGGLPLPHAGPELFGVLPPLELQSALRLVASVTSTVSRCLGIHLPHPILLQPTGPVGDITESILREKDAPEFCGVEDEPNTTAEQATLLSLSTVSSVSKTASARAKVQPQLILIDEERSQSLVAPPSMEPSVVQKRLGHAKAAILAEDNDSNNKATRFALAAAAMHQDEFTIALQLLQNNIVALCIRAGVPVATLWPAEALLLNLHALYVYCKRQIAT